MPRRRVRSKQEETLARATVLARGIVVHLRDAMESARMDDEDGRKAVDLSIRAARRLCVECERELNGFIP